MEITGTRDDKSAILKKKIGFRSCTKKGWVFKKTP